MAPSDRLAGGGEEMLTEDKERDAFVEGERDRRMMKRRRKTEEESRDARSAMVETGSHKIEGEGVECSEDGSEGKTRDIERGS